MIPSPTTLSELCRVLGIGTSELARVEQADHLRHVFSVDSAHAAALDLAATRAFIDSWGDLARIEIRTGDLPELVLEPGVSDEKVSAFIRAAASGGPYDVEVSVDKARLLERLRGTAPQRTVVVFVFGAALREALERGLDWFEANVWTAAPAPLVVAVLDTDASLTGDHLTVLGGSSINGLSAAASAAPSRVDFNEIIAVRDRYIGWDQKWTRALTPWHFDLAGHCADEKLHGLFRAQLVKLAVLYTCDRARSRGAAPATTILAEYRGREHVALIPVDEGAPLEGTERELAAVVQIVAWCYERRGSNGEPDWVSDRLPFIQTRVAQMLEPLPENERLRAFTRAMPNLREGIEWQWKAFVEGKVSEYLDRVQQVETLVGDTVASFAERASALAKGVSDTMLAAVGVLIGSFIAAAFDKPFNATLFRIGVLTYAAYVLIFPCTVGLISSWRNFQTALAEFKSRLARFEETLYPEKVDQIVSDRVTTAETGYTKWVRGVAIAYALVAGASVIAAWKVPGLIS